MAKYTKKEETVAAEIWEGTQKSLQAISDMLKDAGLADQLMVWFSKAGGYGRLMYDVNTQADVGMVFVVCEKVVSVMSQADFNAKYNPV